MLTILDSPLTVKLANSVPAEVYWSTSPPEFCPPLRTTNIAAILNVIKKAKKFIYIAVMDYYAAIVYSYPERLVFVDAVLLLFV